MPTGAPSASLLGTGVEHGMFVVAVLFIGCCACVAVAPVGCGSVLHGASYEASADGRVNLVDRDM